ncbi:MAG TPA: tRNA (N(6)-L-threonylcarbamoyladenosine(37)-C(2))-methylthiotransferase MtaB [Devosiaceae bacterium]|jgi:threonylcarbamoyladenosine tRNA methylthiotransferase MtaB|nr:tRNA (N(6)-L-threonylcarbamoyladenosine(37)-C(2))-methylthiotransferase MtaB [Devosiaceae bacterium]
MAVETLTFGCRLNTYESEVMKAEAEKAGLDNALIVNTCAVTAEAVRQARQSIRKARREYPGRQIIVTGCAAQTEARSFGDMAEVDLVIGNNDKLSAESYAPVAFGVPFNDKVQVNDIMSVRETAGHLIEGMDGRARAFVQVQNGCDHRCTFCIIPYGRGPSRSVPMGAVVEQIKKLVGNGYREVVLTGVDITSYGPDLPGQPTLGKLVQAILRHVPELPRLRISSLDSIEADAALHEAIASERRLMPHFHLSLQSGDDIILKRMKRRHLRADTLAFVEQVRAARPEAVFGADIIAGFPTETDAMFENSLRIIDEAGLTFLHVFPYSPREGTPATRMPQVDRKLARERAALLRAAGDRQFVKLCRSRVGRLESVLVEHAKMGRTEQFLPVRLSPARPGDIIEIEITGADASGLDGVAAKPAPEDDHGYHSLSAGDPRLVHGFA